MRKLTIAIALSSSLLTLPTLAYVQPQIVVETTAYLDNTTGQKVTSHSVNGIEIKLTKTDEVRAEFWGLSREDYAKYLFAMEYTPRGLWTPDLDPPIVLGNLANTHKERMKYADLMNRIEDDRRRREVAFQHVGHEQIEQLLVEQGYVKTADRPDPRKGEFSKHLPDGKYELRSLFVDLDNCDQACNDFVRKHILISSNEVKFDIYSVGMADKTDTELLRTLGISESLTSRGDYNLSRNSAQYKRQTKDKKPPFLIQQTDELTKVIMPE